MQASPKGECLNRRCSQACWSTDEGTAAFCSHQCAYLYTLDVYRRSTSGYALSNSTPTISLGQSARPFRPGKCHTFTLIRCGIDPWAPTAEIQMRQQSCHVLIVVLSRYSRSSSIADYAWPLENMSYCLSHLPQYAEHWDAAICHNSNTKLNCIRRYQQLCRELGRRIENDVPYVCALLTGLVHPSEFYVSIFTK
ncbi:hypothetical protein COEREDRAFT_89968 [Coemansia reversa NRRL 1564]|uniref:Uncharacterized protein n=1 Tax=Coemansia reversa (strain ATCC 12441 / NRRL 1564) TaxID=763665 RepID=A0A2G5B1Q7_COERN|nr:hypothetical protein COEREDRAFT_89968 [Coemansia reversa NRRL 1564]|eukprot:PIA12949.1 hypothetical protein COEREDRAFT_89968 [Coemansia reversa NRRL 1564]